MRISDWSSDVCSADLAAASRIGYYRLRAGRAEEGCQIKRIVEHENPRGRNRSAERTHLLDEDVVGAGAHQQGHKGNPGIRALPTDHHQRGPARPGCGRGQVADAERSEEHTSELQSLMRRSYAGFCLKKKKERNK